MAYASFFLIEKKSIQKDRDGQEATYEQEASTKQSLLDHPKSH